jgi:hypothetical protein
VLLSALRHENARVTTIHIALGLATVATTLAAGLWGAWQWWRVEPSALFWRLLRTAQALLVAEALLGGILLAAGKSPDSDLHYVYGLVPLLVSFGAEGLRIGSAETVLEARGIADADELRERPDAEQRSVVLQIVRREMGVMALAALIMVGLELRAALGT